MDRTTLTAALKPLQRRELIKVSGNPVDRRLRHLELTAAGADLLRRAMPIWYREHAVIERRLAESDPERLRADLRALS
jgi:DNA-binding MarR family transcriptional regulator